MILSSKVVSKNDLTCDIKENGLINHTPFRWHMVDPAYSQGTHVLVKKENQKFRK